MITQQFLAIIFAVNLLGTSNNNVDKNLNIPINNQQLILATDEKIDKENCSIKGKKLYGKVQIVDDFPDIKIQVDNGFPDLHIQLVHAFPDKCGQWQIVDSFPDIKVKFVNAFPDIKVKFVSAFPGIP